MNSFCFLIERDTQMAYNSLFNEHYIWFNLKYSNKHAQKMLVKMKDLHVRALKSFTVLMINICGYFCRLKSIKKPLKKGSYF